MVGLTGAAAFPADPPDKRVNQNHVPGAASDLAQWVYSLPAPN